MLLIGLSVMLMAAVPAQVQAGWWSSLVKAVVDWATSETNTNTARTGLS